MSGHWATPRLRLFSILTLPNSLFQLNNRSNEEGSLFVSYLQTSLAFEQSSEGYQNTAGLITQITRERITDAKIT